MGGQVGDVALRRQERSIDREWCLKLLFTCAIEKGSEAQRIRSKGGDRCQVLRSSGPLEGRWKECLHGIELQNELGKTVLGVVEQSRVNLLVEVIASTKTAKLE